ncbi:hypothetical protein ZWY2020_042416 [Hordeum vulgare]|nr:hypothetical protein ZWY2020_042416 [Hordeum vulgare]
MDGPHRRPWPPPSQSEDGPGGGVHLISSPDLDPGDDVGSLCKAVACGKGNCTVTEVSRKDSRSTLPDPWEDP